MWEIIEAIAEVFGSVVSFIDFIKGVGEDISTTVQEITDVFVQGGTEIIGFADAVTEPVNGVRECLAEMLPNGYVVMVGIALTTMIALATRRSTNA